MAVVMKTINKESCCSNCIVYQMCTKYIVLVDRCGKLGMPIIPVEHKHITNLKWKRQHDKNRQQNSMAGIGIKEEREM